MSRRPTTLLPSGVALLCVLLAGCSAPAAEDARSSDATRSSASEAPLELSAEGPSSAKCMVPNAEVLATQDTAFEGTVTGLDEGTATLSVEQWFAGDTGTDTVTVASPSDELKDLLVAVDFQVGKTYLVSSLDGRVTLCGFTAESTPDLEALYDEAFAG